MTWRLAVRPGAAPRAVATPVYNGPAVTRGQGFLGLSLWYLPWDSAIYTALPDPSLYGFNRYCFVNDSVAGRHMWGWINRTQGVFDWTQLDAWVNFHVARGTELLYSVGGPCPLWGFPTSTNQVTSTFGGVTANMCKEFPSDLTHYVNWLNAVGTRYAGKIRNWLVVNEPDLTPGEYVGTTAQHAVLVRLASQVLKNIDPLNKIIGPEVSNISSAANSGVAGIANFLNASAQGFNGGFGDGAGTTGKDWIDYIGFHPYTDSNVKISDPLQNVTPINDLTRYQNLKNMLAANGVTKPLWASEYMSLASSRWEEEYAFFIRGCVLAAVNGVEKLTWFSTGGSGKPYLKGTPEGAQARNAIAQARDILAAGITQVDIMTDGSLRVIAGGKEYSV